ncbi:MAG: hypothetical protein GY749_23980 [Desulfobacteraceae bacterium]|nr:hypothetical protein [Desulfobacteraceae bacterium]
MTDRIILNEDNLPIVLADRTQKKIGVFCRNPTPDEEKDFQLETARFADKTGSRKYIVAKREARIKYAKKILKDIREGDLKYRDGNNNIVSLTNEVPGWKTVLEKKGDRFLIALGRKVFDEGVTIPKKTSSGTAGLILGEDNLTVFSDWTGKDGGIFYRDPTPDEEIAFQQASAKHIGDMENFLAAKRIARIGYAKRVFQGVRKGDFGWKNEDGSITDLAELDNPLEILSGHGTRYLEILGLLVFDLAAGSSEIEEDEEPDPDGQSGSDNPGENEDGSEKNEGAETTS